MEAICSTNECYKLANSRLLCSICPKQRCCSKFCTKKCYDDNYSTHKTMHTKNLLDKKFDNDLHRFEEMKLMAPTFYDNIIECNPHYRNRLTPENMGCSNVAQCLAIILSSQRFWTSIENDLMNDRVKLTDSVDSLRLTIRKSNRPTVYTCIITCGANKDSLTHYFTIVQDLTNAGVWSFRLYQAYNEGTEQDPAPVYTFEDWLTGNKVSSVLRNAMEADEFNEEFLKPLHQLMLEDDTSSENFRTLWVKLFCGFGSLSRNGSAKLQFWRGNLTLVYAK